MSMDLQGHLQGHPPAWGGRNSSRSTHHAACRFQGGRREVLRCSSPLVQDGRGADHQGRAAGLGHLRLRLLPLAGGADKAAGQGPLEPQAGPVHPSQALVALEPEPGVA